MQGIASHFACPPTNHQENTFLCSPSFQNSPFDCVKGSALYKPFQLSKTFAGSKNKCSNLLNFCFNMHSEDNHWNGSVTDRYIPSRKQLMKGSLYQEQQNNNQWKKEVKLQQNGIALPQIYRKYVMSDSNQNEDQSTECYQNNNLLKYNSSKEFDTKISFASQNSSIKFTEKIMASSTKKRKINKVPFKVLDAPALQDDYYLNLIDWSYKNILAVGLSSSVYMWNAQNSKVNKLTDLGVDNAITSVSWSQKEPFFALGTKSGQVHIWDVIKMKRMHILSGHSNRVGAIAWNSSILSTGSKDKSILHRDLRTNFPFFNKLIGHKQEICGLKWSFDEQQLCSGGNDNKLLVWNSHSNQPIMKFNDHCAAVKAIAWSPHQHGLLVSGGGSADHTIRFRNTLTGITTKVKQAGSQVCNLIFSKTLNEIVSTHGFSHNEINIWKYPKMEKVCTLTGHAHRVLYLAMNPDGSTIVTGAGDETLRFWNVFPVKSEGNKRHLSLLNSENIMLR